MANTKTVEATQILRAITKDQLAALHALRGDSHFADFVGLINTIIINDKDKIVGLQSDVASVDKAIEKATKGNFYRGRISSLVLLHSLMLNAEKELDIREKKNG